MENFTVVHQLLPYLLTIVIIISTLPLSSCEIRNTRIIDDSRPLVVFEQFGFAPDGHVSVSLKHVSWKAKHHTNNPQLNLSSMGFILVRGISFPRILNESEYTQNFCVLSSHFVKVVFKFDKLNINESSSYDSTIVVEEPNEYALIFGNCQPEFQVSMDVHMEMYNIINNGEKDFLSAGQTPLPKLYFLFFIVYATFFVTWISTCIKQKQSVDKIHWIMGALLFFKAMKMICATEDKVYIRTTGTPHGWDVVFYIFGFFKGVTLFTVIILIGTGWSFLKPYLQEREKKLLMFVIPLQVIENIASIIIGETSPATKGWFTWNEMFLMIDVVCCCAVIFPIIWSIRSLTDASKTDGKAARNLRKLTLFKQFYMVVIVYLYFTRVVVSAIGAILNYRYEWVAIAAAEGASLVFYLFIFYNFQPIEHNPYLVINDDSTEEEERANHLLEEDDDSFEL